MRKIVLLIVVSTLILNAQEKKKKSYEDKFALFASVNASFRVAETPSGLTASDEDYVRKLKSGTSFDISAYYLNDEKGYGIKYNAYKSKGEKMASVNYDPAILDTFGYSDDITITFIGPSFIYTERPDAETGEAFLEVALGYMSYKNEASYNFQKFTMKGGTFGMTAGFGYHFRLHRNILVGPNINFVGGVIRKFTIQYDNGFNSELNLDDEQFESLWRIDLGGSVKFRF